MNIVRKDGKLMISTTSGESPLLKNEDQQGEIDLFDNLLDEIGQVEDPHKSLDTQMDKVPIYREDYWLKQYQGRFVSKELGKLYLVKQLYIPRTGILEKFNEIPSDRRFCMRSYVDMQKLFNTGLLHDKERDLQFKSTKEAENFDRNIDKIDMDY
jgi:hypothetical protein